MDGFTDKPADRISDDKFGVRKYIDGLSSFVIECNTPMTIAIQGDWGSGKTSMMNMVRERLGDRVVPVWFNTWQYSQFNMSDELTMSLLTNLVSVLDVRDAKDSPLKKTLSTISSFAKKATIIAADTLIGGKVAEELENAVGRFSGSQDDLNMAKAIDRIKTQFQACVNDSLDKCKLNRIVIFVDDLDRLQPSKAVEMLEVLKLFLDCDNCVFVLAIDYNVVVQGVKQKYGSTIGEEKGRSFFDKIIQVPFKMPLAQYDVSAFVKDMLCQMGIGCDENEIGLYINIIQSSIGCNPRSMKRLFNAFLLLNKVTPDQTLASNRNKVVLFAVLCMQLSFENLYNYIVSKRKFISEEFLTTLADKDKFETYSDSELLKRDLLIENDNDLIRMTSFMKIFNRVIDKDDSRSFSEQELIEFAAILSFSTITSSVEIQGADDLNEKWSVRRNNRIIAKKVSERLTMNHGLEFAVYQSNEDRNNWKSHFASCYKWLYKNDLTYCLDFIIETDLKDKKSRARFEISPRKKTTPNQLFMILEGWPGENDFDYIRTDNGFRREFSLPDIGNDDLIELICREASPIISSLVGYYSSVA